MEIVSCFQSTQAGPLTWEVTKCIHEKVQTVVEKVKKKRKRLNSSVRSLSIEQLGGPRGKSCVYALTKFTRDCKYCPYLKLKHKASGIFGLWPSVRKVNWKCNYRKVYPCNFYSHCYHQVENETDGASSDGSSTIVWWVLFHENLSFTITHRLRQKSFWARIVPLE